MSELILNYYDNEEFCNEILDNMNSDYFSMIAGIMKRDAESESLFTDYVKYATAYLKNLGYDFTVSMGVDWRIVILKGKSSDLTHFKLKYL